MLMIKMYDRIHETHTNDHSGPVMSLDWEMQALDLPPEDALGAVMVIAPHVRYCVRCATRLARDNTDTLCGACSRATRDRLLRPPTLPREFWDTDQMRDALATWHMGHVIYAYRTHPYHGQPLPQTIVGNWFCLTQTQLSRIEKGKPPEELSKLIRWAQILGIPSELLWFKLPEERTEHILTNPSPSQPQRSKQDSSEGQPDCSEVELYNGQYWHQLLKAWNDSVDRREFIEASAGIAAIAAMPAFELLASLSHTPAPKEVREHDIQQVRSAARMFTSWDHTYGGGIVREAVTAQLRWSAQLLETDCPERLRPALFSAVGYLSGVCGFMAFDAYAHEDARRMFVFGLTCAEAAGDWHLRAKLLSHMARQAIWCGTIDSGLTYTELALVRADRLTGTERAMLHTARARALAKLGRVKETLLAVASADEAFAESEPGKDPPWMAYYDYAQHHGDTGHALFDLAVHGHPPITATHRLTEAVNGHTDAYARSRAISGTKLASLLMVTGDPHEAATVGQRAMDDAGRLRSWRAADDLRELHRFANPHAVMPMIAELRGRIRGLVGTL
jgi:transcriptional regulator with XRE-family HTH domain